VKKPIIVANWKMYVQKPDAAKLFVSTLKRRSHLLGKIDVTIAPPFTLVPTLSAAFGTSKTLKLGAQTVSAYADPQHTGDVSASMLKSWRVSTAIVGHSERRRAGENDETIRAQIVAAHAAGLTALLCVGEESRDPAGGHFTLIQQQLSVALGANSGGKIVVAYEPVWAIGKSAADAMKPQELEEMAIFIRKTLTDVLGREQALKVPVLYGGSVEAENAHELLHEGNVSGFLVGHASAGAASFISILEACLA
jgi:triosephosphate isomerase